MFELTHPQIRKWWDMIRATHQHNETQRGWPMLGYYRIFVQEIPNENCYRFLDMKGYKCNATGEILLSSEEIEEYTCFQQMLLEGKEND